MRKLAEERCEQILEHVRATGSATVAGLAIDCDVSDMTIRRDLEHLEALGLVRRVHGGAIPVESARFGDRLTTNAPAKKSAAHKLLSYVPRTGTIYVDGSTTMMQLIEHLPPSGCLIAATNNIEAFRRLGAVPGVEALLIGGRLDTRTDNMVGTLSLKSLEALAFEAAFFSCWGLSARTGPMEVTLEDAAVKQCVADRAQAVCLAVDDSKFDRFAGGTWRPDAQRATLATNLKPHEQALDPFRQRFAAIL